MSGDGDVENLILRTIERWWAGRYSEKHGLVTSYDPDKYLAKVTFQPEGQESGWLPIETGHIGNGFGIAVGLTPGDGKESGDQVIVRYQEGDVESGKIVQRVHSDKEKPPKVESGEMVQWHEKGAKIFFKKDGSITIEDGKGATIKLDGKGNIANDSKTYTVVGTDVGIKGGQNVEVKAGSVLGLDGASKVIVQGNGDVSDGSVSQPSDQPPLDAFEVPG